MDKLGNQLGHEGGAVKPDRVRKDKAEGTEKAAGNADLGPVLLVN